MPFRQVSNLSTTKEHILWFCLNWIEWKHMNVCWWWSLRNMIWLTKEEEESSRASVQRERVNIYIWMEIIDWKCSNEMNIWAIDTNLFSILNISIADRPLVDKNHMSVLLINQLNFKRENDCFFFLLLWLFKTRNEIVTDKKSQV